MDNKLSVKIPKDSLSLEKNEEKCINCNTCKKLCENEIIVSKLNKNSNICIDCGQCSNLCPNESIHEKFDYIKVKNILKNKQNKKICFSLAPAVRVAIGEEFELPLGKNLDKKIVAALKEIGADYVFDITLGADLTIIEEACEFIKRVNNKTNLPMFSSCCPSWVKYVEIFYPNLIPNLSTTKSPIAILGTIIKTYFADKEKINSDDIISIVIAPCTSKKSEIKRKDISYKNQDIDYVLTTRELAMLLKEYNLDIFSFTEKDFDNPLGSGSSAGLIFGNSGGVSEALIRSMNYFLTGNNLNENDIIIEDARKNNKIKKINININNKEYKIAICNGIKNADELINKILNKEEYFDFIEVMNCTNGCINGGGQPKITLLNMVKTKNERTNSLYNEDNKSKLRFCHENPSIKEIYKNFLEKPNSEIAEKLLHRTYEDKSYLLERN